MKNQYIVLFITAIFYGSIGYAFQNWEHPYKLNLSSFVQIQESLQRQKYSNSHIYEDQFLMAKPLYVILCQQIPLLIDYVQILMVICIVLSQFLLHNTFQFTEAQYIIFNVFYTCNPYMYMALFEKDTLIFEFFLICFLLYKCIKQEKQLESYLIVALLIFLNLQNTLMMIVPLFYLKNQNKKQLVSLCVSSTIFLFVMTYTYFQNWVQQKAIFEATLLQLRKWFDFYEF